METKTIKVSETNYRNICEYAGTLQQEWGEPVSLDKALSHLFRKGKISDLAGRWKMTDKEETEMMKSLRRGWKSWKIPPA